MTAEGALVPRAVLFDLDGVLVDSFESWFAVVNRAAERLGTPGIDRRRFRELFGQGPEDDARTFYPGHDVRTIQAIYDEEMPRHVDRIEVGGETWAVLEDLGRRGIGRAVVTNTPTALADLILGVADLHDRIDAWVGVDDDLKEKPAPDLLVRALQLLELDPSEALLVGDSRYDEEAARALSMTFVHFDLGRGGSLAEALGGHLVG